MITIICAGSRGDFQPYVALAQRLKILGEEVKISGFSQFENFVRGYGIDYVPIEVDYEELGVDPKMLKQAGSADNPLKMILTFNKMKKYGAQIAKQTYDSLEGSELIVYHPGCVIGYFAAQEMNIPSVLATPFPMNKTEEYLSVVTYGKARPTNINKKISYKMIQGMLWLASSNTVKQHWKERFGRVPKNFKSPYEKISKDHIAMVSCSNFVFPRPKDWDKNIYQSGYWFVEENKEYKPSKELEAFINNGEKPVYIGFGSVFDSDEKDKIVRIIIDALKKCGKRGIISGMGKVDNLPDNIISVDGIPHTWLFEKVSVVCHHGGAGTTAAGFRAGVPSVIIPFSNDQFAWAHRAFDLGVGAKPIYKKDLTADKLAEGINYALNKDIIERAEMLSKNIALEDGALDCAKKIVDILNR
ncbi:UDP-glucoronosyl and UDP-glucosyl transferase family protein [[Clostridium] bifermentans ATCC 19299]|uniref:glycosyltransferase n=1 Tax=Paraclostridium bifermentans TaxID=1490 RepID=UPI00038D5681|nr:glycosyltransferase [Paraclostridium bifermentans]EQK39583.1 UDP-glucoronosyl and UDP-glucosyl transferase family protein [[Clostridium] bifermentans ATCC 19299] [Paraclostridium bifermentans ATCC 19299]